MAWVWSEDVRAKNHPKSTMISSWPTPEKQIKSTAMSGKDDRKVGSLKSMKSFKQREVFSDQNLEKMIYLM
jgi:hypothetical protein